MGWTSTHMKIINNYQDISPGPLQRARLYLSGHPLAALYRKKIKNITYAEPDYVHAIDQELAGNYISIDCAGWHFANDHRQCIAIEHHPISQTQWPVVFEYDYMNWRPTYLPYHTVLCYRSVEFRYATLTQLAGFFNTWGSQHGKYIVGLDPTKIKFNYLKYSLLDQLSQLITWPHAIRVLRADDFELLFVLESA